MAGHKLSAGQQRRVDLLKEYTGTIDHVRRLVSELDANRAARGQFLDNICSSIARELSQLRQKAMTNPVGTMGDTAGTCAVIAGRAGAGIALKIRALNDGVNTISMQIDQAMKAALQPDKDKDKDKGKDAH